MASAAVAALSMMAPIASAHPGHEGHGLAPQAPIGQFTVISLGLTIVAVGAYAIVQHVQKKRR
jgi:hypothetical protein